MAYIEIKELKVDFLFGKKVLQAVRGVDFELNRGELLAIVGESGSGKSVTAMSLLQLNGKNSVSYGDVLFEGKCVFNLTKKNLIEYRKNNFGVIFQEPGSSFDPIYTIGKCFYETFRVSNSKIKKSESDKRAIKLLSEVHISNPESRLNNYPHQFSGGMLQRVMIALSLANNPKILVADEPTTALDVTIQSGIIKLLLELKEKRKLSILFITHDLGLVSAIADRIIVMYGGLILEVGSASEVLLSPRSPYTKELLASMPKAGAHYKDGELQTIAGVVPNPLKPEAGCPFAPRCKVVIKKCETQLPPMINAEDNRSFRCFNPIK